MGSGTSFANVIPTPFNKLYFLKIEMIQKT